MKTKLIKIGNSQGLRIPKTLIEQCGLDDELIMSVDGGKLVIRPARTPRQGWSDDDQVAGSENVSIDEIQNDFDEEWTW